MMRSPQYTDHHLHRNSSDRKKKGKSKKSKTKSDILMDSKVASMIRDSSSPVDLREISPDEPGWVIRELDSSPVTTERRRYPRQMLKSIRDAMFIAQHIDNEDDFNMVKGEWRYMAMVLDRLFLWMFTAACVIGTAGIFLQAPLLYDTESPIDVMSSKVAHTLRVDWTA